MEKIEVVSRSLGLWLKIPVCFSVTSFRTRATSLSAVCIVPAPAQPVNTPTHESQGDRI